MARSLVVNIVGDSTSLDRALKKSQKSVDTFGRNVNRSSRGAIAASGAFSSMGRSIAFASGSFLGAAGADRGHEVRRHGRHRPRAADLEDECRLRRVGQGGHGLVEDARHLLRPLAARGADDGLLLRRPLRAGRTDRRQRGRAVEAADRARRRPRLLLQHRRRLGARCAALRPRRRVGAAAQVRRPSLRGARPAGGADRVRQGQRQEPDRAGEDARSDHDHHAGLDAGPGRLRAHLEDGGEPDQDPGREHREPEGQRRHVHGPGPECGRQRDESTSSTCDEAAHQPTACRSLRTAADVQKYLAEQRRLRNLPTTSSRSRSPSAARSSAERRSPPRRRRRRRRRPPRWRRRPPPGYGQPRRPPARRRKTGPPSPSTRRS